MGPSIESPLKNAPQAVLGKDVYIASKEISLGRKMPLQSWLTLPLAATIGLIAGTAGYLLAKDKRRQGDVIISYPSHLRSEVHPLIEKMRQDEPSVNIVEETKFLQKGVMIDISAKSESKLWNNIHSFMTALNNKQIQVGEIFRWDNGMVAKYPSLYTGDSEYSRKKFGDPSRVTATNITR